MTAPHLLRLANEEDIPALCELIPLSARGLRGSYYSARQVEGALGPVFGVDRQLIRDGTYFVAESGGVLAGCGGWSKRRSPYGGDSDRQGEDPLRDPRTEPAMIRAFFVHPDHARRGIGRSIMLACESAARAAGFTGVEIVATLPGEPLYATFGYIAVERFAIPLPNGENLPVVRMRK